MEVAALKIQDKIEEKVFVELLGKIDTDKQNRIKRFLQYQDRQRSLFADLLARMMLMKIIGIANTDIRFCPQPSGKPVLLHHPGIYFNTSHSGDWITCIVDTNEAGIDVEQEGDIDLSLSDSFFCADEHNNIMQAENPHQKFFEYWTLKESYIKFKGTGLLQPLNSFSIRFFEGAEIRVVTNGLLVPDVYFKQYDIETGYKLAACATHNNFPEVCTVYSVEEIIDKVSSPTTHS